MQGGFIWDWVDQGFQMTDEAGRNYWSYGGDMGIKIIQMMRISVTTDCLPDRTPKPGLLEVKKFYQRHHFKQFNLRNGANHSCK
jgi:beta-galactosidase